MAPGMERLWFLRCALATWLMQACVQSVIICLLHGCMVSLLPSAHEALRAAPLLLLLHHVVSAIYQGNAQTI
jgi:hypothetical protein